VLVGVDGGSADDAAETGALSDQALHGSVDVSAQAVFVDSRHRSSLRLRLAGFGSGPRSEISAFWLSRVLSASEAPQRRECFGNALAASDVILAGSGAAAAACRIAYCVGKARRRRGRRSSDSRRRPTPVRSRCRQRSSVAQRLGGTKAIVSDLSASASSRHDARPPASMAVCSATEPQQAAPLDRRSAVTRSPATRMDSGTGDARSTADRRW
jgi:hypothetical protein